METMFFYLVIDWNGPCQAGMLVWFAGEVFAGACHWGLGEWLKARFSQFGGNRAMQFSGVLHHKQEFTFDSSLAMVLFRVPVPPVWQYVA